MMTRLYVGEPSGRCAASSMNLISLALPHTASAGIARPTPYTGRFVDILSSSNGWRRKLPGRYAEGDVREAPPTL